MKKFTGANKYLRLLVGGFISFMVFLTAALVYVRNIPRESNRIFHPLGFSVIVPLGWDVECAQEGKVHRTGHGLIYDNDFIRTDRNFNSRFMYGFTIFRLKEKSKKFVATSDKLNFPGVTFEDGQQGKYYLWSALIPEQPDGYQYLIEVWLPDDDLDYHSDVPDYLYRFLNTFQPAAESKRVKQESI